MPKLSVEQVLSIEKLIHSAVSDQLLRIELADHVCCAVEDALNTGKSFDYALNEALHQLNPDGAAAIEQELLFLLTPQIPIIMKKLLYGCGFIAAIGMSSGIMFRQFNWSGSAVLMLIGSIGLLVAMGTLLYQVVKFPGIMSVQARIRLIAGALGGILVSTGTLFKIQHFPTANIQVGLGMIILIILFIPLFFWELYQREIRSAQ
ncbi:MAG: hypothetical protein ACK5CY_12615 [Bacteroidia bacterium]|jgi:hypothetical protein